jgi:hypothetical protein
MHRVRSRVAHSSDSHILDLFVRTELRRRWQVELNIMMGLVCTHNINGVDDDGVWAHRSGEYVSGGVMFIWPLVWEEWPWRRWFGGRHLR